MGLRESFGMLLKITRTDVNRRITLRRCIHVQREPDLKKRLADAGRVLLVERHPLRRSIPSKYRWVRSSLPVTGQCSTHSLKIPELTIDLALISLITDSTHQLCDSLFPIQSNRNRLVVVTEQASECGV